MKKTNYFILSIIALSIFGCTNDGGTEKIPETPTPAAEETVNYCTHKGGDATVESLAKVEFGTINNPSTNNKVGYEDFTKISGDFARSSSYLMKLTPKLSTNPGDFLASVRYLVYIDYNGDGDFTDPGEAVWMSEENRELSGVSTTITIPETAKLGHTRMRIAIKSVLNLSYPPVFGDACGDFGWGQVEDYTLNIKAKL